MSALADSNPEVDNMSRYAEFLSNFPAGSSYQDFAFFAQDVVSDEFLQFNYGPVENVKRYG